MPESIFLQKSHTYIVNDKGFNSFWRGLKKLLRPYKKKLLDSQTQLDVSGWSHIMISFSVGFFFQPMKIHDTGVFLLF